MSYKFIPTNQQLQDALQHILYEIRQFLEVNRALQGDYIVLRGLSCELNRGTSTPWTTVDLNNSFLESFLVHTRILQDFFCRSKRTDDDILVTDYAYPIQQWKIVDSQRYAINKYLAHLTYSRSSKYEWPVADIAFEILPCCQDLIQHLVNTRIPTDDDETISNCQQLVEEINNFLHSKTRVHN